jgi:hypothetical protein
MSNTQTHRQSICSPLSPKQNLAPASLPAQDTESQKEIAQSKGLAVGIMIQQEKVVIIGRFVAGKQLPSLVESCSSERLVVCLINLW